MQNSKNKITAIIRLMQEGCLPDDVPPPDCSDYEHNTFIPHPFSKCYNLWKKLISSALEPVLSHTEFMYCIVLYPVSTSIKMYNHKINASFFQLVLLASWD